MDARRFKRRLEKEALKLQKQRVPEFRGASDDMLRWHFYDAQSDSHMFLVVDRQYPFQPPVGLELDGRKIYFTPRPGGPANNWDEQMQLQNFLGLLLPDVRAAKLDAGFQRGDEFAGTNFYLTDPAPGATAQNTSSSRATIQRNLERFAHDTRHRPQQYETPAQTAHLLRKMLAASVKAVPWGDVYAHVSPGDYARFRKRAETSGPPIESRAPPAASFYEALARDLSLEDTSQNLAHDFGRDVGEQRPETAFALLLCCASQGDTRQLCNSLYREDAERRERVYDALQREAPRTFALPRLGEELGLLIRSARFPSIHEGRVFVSEPLQRVSPGAARSSDANEQKENGLEVDALLRPHSPQPVDWAGAEAGLQAWKRDQVLSPIFPDKKVAKQLFVAVHAPAHAHLLREHGLLGKFQSEKSLVTASYNPQHGATAYKNLLAGAPAEGVERLWHTPSVQAYAQDLARKTPSAKLKALGKADVLYMYMQSGVPVGPDFVDAVLQL